MRKSSVYTIVACLLLAALPFSASADATEDIPANAQATGVHDSLVAALSHVDLVATLQGDGPFTVFAPTDQAFADAGIDLDTFDTPEENETLVDILLYHVYSGNVSSSEVTDGLSVEMMNGDSVSFAVADGVVTIGEATVTTADVNASNGIIHVIDKVLMPPADDPFDGIDCAVTVGLTSDGYGFTPSIINIDVGQTVCWSWTDAGMAHNVKQVDGFQSSTYVTGGSPQGLRQQP